MKEAPYSVLVVDDSALMRNLVGKIFESCEHTEDVGKAMNGRFALQKIDSLEPEVIVLDLEMPEMNGLEFLTERKKRGIDIPVVVLSSIARKGAKVTMDALALGASDFVLKPSGSVSTDIHTVADQLTELAVNLGAAYRRKHGPRKATLSTAAGTAVSKRTATATTTPPAPEDAPFVPATRPSISPGPIDVVAIGISTGGPNALRKVFAQFSEALPAALLIVQHMPPGFTAEFARSLDKVGPMSVREAVDREALEPGTALVAPGDFHLTVERTTAGYIARVQQEPPQNGHRPSADVLFKSVAEQCSKRALGVIMTGMGKDGAKQLGAILRAGGLTLGQDAATSVVYGMPRVAAELGHVERQVALHEVADAISQLVAHYR